MVTSLKASWKGSKRIEGFRTCPNSEVVKACQMIHEVHDEFFSNVLSKPPCDALTDASVYM